MYPQYEAYGFCGSFLDRVVNGEPLPSEQPRPDTVKENSPSEPSISTPISPRILDSDAPGSTNYSSITTSKPSVDTTNKITRSLLSLPNEIIFLILGNCSIRDLKSLRYTCKLFNAYLSDIRNFDIYTSIPSLCTENNGAIWVEYRIKNKRFVKRVLMREHEAAGLGDRGRGSGGGEKGVEFPNIVDSGNGDVYHAVRLRWSSVSVAIMGEERLRKVKNEDGKVRRWQPPELIGWEFAVWKPDSEVVRDCNGKGELIMRWWVENVG